MAMATHRSPGEKLWYCMACRSAATKSFTDACRELTHDGAHDAGRGRDLEGREEVWRAGRQSELVQDRAPVRGIGTHQLEGARVRAAHTAEGSDGDRKEGQVGGHDGHPEPSRP